MRWRTAAAVVVSTSAAVSAVAEAIHEIKELLGQ